MADISIEKLAGEVFKVEVKEGTSVTYHEVTARAEDVARLGGGNDPVGLIEASFEFLLEREPKESILRSFELPTIGRYFPEYPTEIVERLAGGD